MRLLNRNSAIKTLKAYVLAVNNRDLDAVAGILAEDVLLVDSSGRTLSGHAACLDVVERVFTKVPDYQLRIDTYTTHGDEVLMTGLSHSQARQLSAATHFRAHADGRFLYEWHSFSAQPVQTLAHLLADSVPPAPVVEAQPASAVRPAA